MVLMSLKIDPKLVAVASIILGLFLGFYVNNTLLSKPRIEALTNQTLTQQEIIDGLGNELSALQSEYNTLDALFTQLQENNVPLNIYETLQGEADAMGVLISELENQVDDLNDSVDDLEYQLDELEDEYASLTSDHDSLQERFDDIYNPGYVAFTANGLNINLTVTETQFEGNMPIQGTVTIKHTDGSLFEGSVQLRITKVYIGVGVPSDEYFIHGETDYSWSGAFVPGAGSYKLSLSEILDSQGADVVSGTTLRANYISIFMG